MRMNRIDDQALEHVAGGILDWKEAMGAALDHAQLSRDQLDFVKKCELDCENGRQVYEIKFYHGGMQYEYDIDAESGVVLKFERDFD